MNNILLKKQRSLCNFFIKADDEPLPDLVVSRRGKSSADVDKEGKRVCEFCKRDVARESYALHLKTCLSMKFKRGTVSNKGVYRWSLVKTS